MNLVSAMAFLHIVFAALWTGSVVFVTWGVLPVARNGSLETSAISTIVSRLVTLSRASAAVLLVSGGMMAGRYGDAIMNTTGGYLVLGMAVLWLLLIGFVELAARTLTDALATDAPGDAVGVASDRFNAAGTVALLLLVDAGLLAAL
ncbi:MAG: transporter [Halodesulfurarchaeum sp.]|nr:transporter [Halodesulfurarchaeum sp.]